MDTKDQNAGIEQPKSLWGANPRVRNTVLVIVATLIVGRTITTLWLVEDNWRPAARWLGLSVVPNPDPANANAKLRAGNLQSALGSPSNYPQDALERGEQGVVAAKLLIGPDGRVASCTVSRSSGSASLDAATCQIARREARFEPARDSAGRAKSSEFILRMRWVLPDAAE